jgi:L-lactate dehydrogenase
MRKTGGAKVAIVGAGFVGSTFAYSLSISGLVSEIVLIDTDTERATGEAMDLSHGVPFLQPVEIHAGDYAECADCDIVAVTAGAARKPGQTRMDLATQNYALIKDIIPQVSKHNQDCVLLMVTNPLDVMTYAAHKLSNFPKNKIIGSGTILDTARLRYALSNYLNVDARNVHAYIIGEHGDTEVPVWSLASVAGVRLKEYCPLCSVPYKSDVFDELFLEVRDAGKKVIAKKGRTNYSIGLSCTRIVESILRDENSVLTVSCLLDNYKGVGDVCLSVPAVVNREGIARVIDLPLDAAEEAAFVKSGEAVKEINRSLGIR